LHFLGRRADLLVVAVGNPELVKAHWVKPGAVVLDVGINVVEGEGGESRVVGDVAFKEVSQVAGETEAVTPCDDLGMSQWSRHHWKIVLPSGECWLQSGPQLDMGDGMVSERLRVVRCRTLREKFAFVAACQGIRCEGGAMQRCLWHIS